LEGKSASGTERINGANGIEPRVHDVIAQAELQAAKQRSGHGPRIARPHVGVAALGHPRARVVDSARLRAAILALMFGAEVW